MASNPVILCVNGGSSSLKVALYQLTAGSETMIGQEIVETKDASSKIRAVLDALEARRFPAPDAVGHRLVHGGPHHLRAQRIDAPLLASLRLAVPFAPLHLPAEIRAIEAVADKYPRLPQVACFDTGFHRDMPEVARRLPLPWALYDQGIRRYGFHGLSYEYVVETLGAHLAGRAIVAHLGSGASMVALKNGKPVDTTMGLTPAGGFMMGTRSGDLDPGVLFHLIDLGYSPRDLDRMLSHESGLLGVSGSTSDMKALLARRGNDQRAALAVEMFCYQVRKTIGALTAVLGGLDSLVFTGGIGEHAAPVRSRICMGLQHLGILIDTARNERAEGVVSSSDSPCTVRVIKTNEERTIASHARRVLFAC
jgi:acetate kinase